MSVASLELCKELYELSGWKTPEYRSYYRGFDDVSVFDDNNEIPSDMNEVCPAYDLGYLLRKLQATATREWSNGWEAAEFRIMWDAIDRDWVVHFFNTDMDNDKWFDDVGAPGHVRFLMPHEKTPEDCLAALAIELFKQNILTKEPQS